MAPLIRRMWLPTLVLLVLTIAIGLWQIGGVMVVYSAITVILLTPIVWLRSADRSERVSVGRGAAAGAVIAGIAQLLPTLLEAASFAIGGNGPVDGMGKGLTMIGILFALGVACMAAVFGSVVGALLAISGPKAGHTHVQVQ